ncbi:MAG: RNA methyltransferase [Candidatus Andersenbacteria bacterium]|nr:RNA methyltransferase [Candidatus Andersenbacteria bacterium]
MPVVSERTIKKDVRLGRLQKIMKEAAEQSGRGIVPALHQIVPFENAVGDAKTYEAGFLFDASGPPFEADMAKEKHSVAIFIGPEGGWSEKELHLAEKSGLFIMSLGLLTLRAETAAIVAAYVATR